MRAVARAVMVVAVLLVVAASVYPPVGATAASGAVSLSVEGVADFGGDPVAAPLGDGYIAVVATGRGLVAAGLEGYYVVDGSVRPSLVSGIASSPLPGGGYVVALVHGGDLLVYTYSGGSWERLSISLAGLGLEEPYRLLGLSATGRGPVALVGHSGGVVAVDALKGEPLGYVAWRSLGFAGVEAVAAGEGFAVVCGSGSLALLSLEGGVRVVGRAPAPQDGCRGASLVNGYIAVYSGSLAVFYEAYDLEVADALRAADGYRVAGAVVAGEPGSPVGVVALQGEEAILYALPLDDDEGVAASLRLGQARIAGLASSPRGSVLVALAEPRLVLALVEASSTEGAARLRLAWEGGLDAVMLGGRLTVLPLDDGGFAVAGPTTAAVITGGGGVRVEPLPLPGTAETLALGGGLALALHSGRGYSYAYLVDPESGDVVGVYSLERAVAGGGPGGVAAASPAGGGIAVLLASGGSASIKLIPVEGEPLAAAYGPDMLYLAVSTGDSATLYSVNPETGRIEGEAPLAASGPVALAAAPGGAPLAVALSGEILLLDPETLALIKRLAAPDGEPVALEWAPGAEGLAAAYSSGGSGVLVALGPWGRAVAVLSVEPLDVAWVDGETVAVALSGGSLALYRLVDEGLELVALEALGVHALEPLEPGRLLALGGGSTLSIVEASLSPGSTESASTTTTTVTATTTVTETTTSTVTSTVTETLTQTVTSTVTTTATTTVTETETETVTSTVTETITVTETETVTEVEEATETVTVTELATLTALQTVTVTTTSTVEREPETLVYTETVTETTVSISTVTATVQQEPVGGPSLGAILLALAMILASTVIALAIDRGRG